MATLVQSASKIITGVNNTTLAFTSAVTAGNMIAVSQVHATGANDAVSTPTDTLGHTYVQMSAEQAANLVKLKSFYVKNIIGGANTVTFGIAGTNTGEMAVVIAEINGIDRGNPLDVVSTGSGSDTLPTSGNITPGFGNSFLYAALCVNANNNAITDEAGWTTLEKLVPVSSVPIATEYKVQIGITTEDATWTLGASANWVAMVAAFKTERVPPNKRLGSIPPYLI